MPGLTRISALLFLSAALPAAAQDAPPVLGKGAKRLARGAVESTLRRDATVRAVEAVGPAVANIATVALRSVKTRADVRSLEEWVGHSKQAPKRFASLGSGVVIDPDGYLLTNAHVIQRGSRILVTLPGRKQLRARVLALLPDHDLALLKVDAKRPLPVVKLAEAGDVYVGETCIALGNPFGLENTVTRGVVSARNRRLKSRGRELLGGFIQTDAAINPGNSGGALVNLDGELIGINAAIHAGGQGIGFAIPVARLHAALVALADPFLMRGLYLGMRVVAAKGRGARIERVIPNSPAARAGLTAGDLILTAGPRQVTSPFGFYKTFLGRTAPTRVRLLVVGPDGKRRGAILQDLFPPWRAPIQKRMGFLARNLTPTLAWRIGTSLRRAVVVRRVDANGPAAKLGLRPGDLIVRVARRARTAGGKKLEAFPIRNGRALARFLAQTARPETILVEVRRQKQGYFGKLTLR